MTKLEVKRLEEILKKISEFPQLETPITYHPSECVNSEINPQLDDKMPCKTGEKILDIISQYHVYCNLCKHHYYSSSKLNDINSFFQIHINSVDHVWNKRNSKNDMTKPVLKWEKWLCTGFCTICNKSGIETFIIDSTFDLLSIIQKHLRSNKHKENLDLIFKRSFSRIMAKFDMFSKIYIRPISNDTYLCKVCDLIIERESLLENHLNSKLHNKKFCSLLKKELNVNIDTEGKELDMEELAKRMNQLPEIKKNSNVNIKRNSPQNYELEYYEKEELEFLTGSHLGFSPLLMEKSHSVLDEDLQQVTFCALCQWYPTDMDLHLKTNSHKMRVMVFNQCNSVCPVSLVDYLYVFRSTPMELRPEVEKYLKYKFALKEHDLDFGKPSEEENLNIDLPVKQLNLGLRKERINEIIGANKRQKEDLPREHSQPTSLKISENIGAMLQVLKNCDLDKFKSEETKNQKPDTKIKVEKMNKVDILAVRKSMEEFFQSIIPDEYRLFFKNIKCHSSAEMVRKYVKKDCRKEDVRVLTSLMRYQNDPNFICVFEKWSIQHKSRFVCIVCGTVERYVKYIFDHLKKTKHTDSYEKVKCGSLNAISALDYSFDFKKGLYICDKCGAGICKISEPPKILGIHQAAEAIRLHEMSCSKKEANSFHEGADENNKRTVSQELVGKISIGLRQSNQDKTSDSVTNGVDVQKEITCETNKTNERKPQSKASSGKVKIEERKKEEREAKGNSMTTEKKVFEEKKAISTINKRDRPDSIISPNKNNTERKIKKKDERRGKGLKACLLNFLEKFSGASTEYLCIICLVNDQISGALDHVASEMHIINENYIRTKWKCNITICHFCKILLLGTTDMFEQHYSSSYHTKKESEVTGRKITAKPLLPKVVNILIIKGKLFMERKKNEEFIRNILAPFGFISRLTVKNFHAEAEFTDEKVVSRIVALKKFYYAPKKSLNFSSRSISKELAIPMTSTLIDLLAHTDMSGVLISHLIEKANSMLFSEEEREKEELLCDSLKEVIGVIYPYCKCFKFGSRVTGLTIGKCDLDVFLDYDNVYYSDNSDPVEQGKIVKKVVSILKASRDFTQIIGIENCRVPIVTCLHIQTGIQCDISFKNGLSCENTKLIKFMISLDDRVTRVLLFLKFWIKLNDLHGRPCFSSYALTILVIFYLQQEPNPILPTVEFLKNCCENPEKVIEDWDCSFTTNRELVPKTNNSDSVIQLILGFYNFCENFDFSKYIVSPLTGKPLPREVFTNMEKNSLPAPYDKYQTKLDPKNYSDHDLICVMDPFDLNHNLTKFFPKLSFKKFLYLCRISASLLSRSFQSKSFEHLFINDQVLTNNLNSS